MTVVVPVLNERDSIRTLADEIDQAFEQRPDLHHGVVFVDDGSTDGSWEEVVKLAEEHNHIQGMRLRRNFGKAAALAIGCDVAPGGIIITMDGDLQDDPAEIPRFLGALELGADLVSGWKKIRRDPLTKRLPSKLFNWATSAVCGLDLHDHNCGFKAGQHEIFSRIPLYGELHRYIPVMAHDLGYRITELEVKHRPRVHGRSKYGFERYARGMLDLFTVLIITRYGRRPGHFFGGIGILFGLIGFAMLAYLTGVWIFTDRAIGGRPLLIFGVLFEVVAVQLVSIGILSELLLHQTSSRPQHDEVVVASVGTTG